MCVCVCVCACVCVCVRYIAAHMVGRRLIYPGSVLLLNLAVGECGLHSCITRICLISFLSIIQLNRCLREEPLTKERYSIHTYCTLSLL